MQNTGQRYVYYKGGYFLDWCRTVNSLVGEEDAEYQVGVFERTLMKQAYYHQVGAKGPLAQVMSWEDAMKLLGELDLENKVQTAHEEHVPEAPVGNIPRSKTKGLGDSPRKERKSSVSQLFGKFRRQSKAAGKEPVTTVTTIPVVGCK